MDVLHDRLIWQVLSGGHAFSPLRTDYRKTHASYPLCTASNPLGSAPILLFALMQQSVWTVRSRQYAVASRTGRDAFAVMHSVYYILRNDRRGHTRKGTRLQRRYEASPTTNSTRSSSI